MFLCWKNECHNQYNNGLLDAIGLVVVAVAVAKAVFVSKRRLKHKNVHIYFHHKQNNNEI